MVSFYYIIDMLLIVLISYSTYISYKNKSYIKIFNYFKIFLLITLSAKLASYTGVALQKLYITKFDTYTTLILVGFSINLILLVYVGKFLFKLSNQYINSVQLKKVLAQITTFVEVFILITFALYIIMQLYISKIYLYPSIKQSFSYPKIEKFYKSFLSDDFVNMILNSDTGTNHKEIIFKSLKNSI